MAPSFPHIMLDMRVIKSDGSISALRFPVGANTNVDVVFTSNNRPSHTTFTLPLIECALPREQTCASSISETLSNSVMNPPESRPRTTEVMNGNSSRSLPSPANPQLVPTKGNGGGLVRGQERPDRLTIGNARKNAGVLAEGGEGRQRKRPQKGTYPCERCGRVIESAPLYESDMASYYKAEDTKEERVARQTANRLKKRRSGDGMREGSGSI